MDGIADNNDQAAKCDVDDSFSLPPFQEDQDDLGSMCTDPQDDLFSFDSCVQETVVGDDIDESGVLTGDS